MRKLSLDCQYDNTTGSQVITDGCIGYEGEYGEEEASIDRTKISNATIAAVQITNSYGQNTGPFKGGEIQPSSKGSNAQNATCKVSGTSGQSTKSASISSITVSNTQVVGSNNTATIVLTSAPTTHLWEGEMFTLSNGPTGSTMFSPIPSTIVDETSNTYGFWVVWSVISTTQFLIMVPSTITSLNNCSSSCGRVDFYPMGINVFIPFSNLTQNRGFDSWTVNGSSCPGSSPTYGNFPPLAIQVSGGNTPFSNIHVEGYRVGVCVGCFSVSDREQPDQPLARSELADWNPNQQPIPGHQP